MFLKVASLHLKTKMTASLEARRLSVGQIKMHAPGSAITLLRVGEWVTVVDVWGFGSANLTTTYKRKEKMKGEIKAFHWRTTFPLAEWIDTRCEPRMSPLPRPSPLQRPLRFHHRHSSPKPHTRGARAGRSGPHDKLLLGLLSKISTSRREWPGWERRWGGEEGRGGEERGKQTKPSEAPQTKEGWGVGRVAFLQ